MILQESFFFNSVTVFFNLNVFSFLFFFSYFFPLKPWKLSVQHLRWYCVGLWFRVIIKTCENKNELYDWANVNDMLNDPSHIFYLSTLHTSHDHENSKHVLDSVSQTVQSDSIDSPKLQQ